MVIANLKGWDFKLKKMRLTTYEKYVLQIYNYCEKYKCLPDGKSLEKQRWDFMYLFNSMDVVRNEYLKKNKG